MSLEFDNSSITPFLENDTEICPGIMSEEKTLIHSRLQLLMCLGEYIHVIYINKRQSIVLLDDLG